MTLVFGCVEALAHRRVREGMLGRPSIPRVLRVGSSAVWSPTRSLALGQVGRVDRENHECGQHGLKFRVTGIRGRPCTVRWRVARSASARNDKDDSEGGLSSDSSWSGEKDSEEAHASGSAHLRPLEERGSRGVIVGSTKARAVQLGQKSRALLKMGETFPINVGGRAHAPDEGLHPHAMGCVYASTEFVVARRQLLLP